MADAKICDRCGEHFRGWRPVTRKYLLHVDVLRNSTTPTVRHKPLDLCGCCNEELKEWYEDADTERSDEVMTDGGRDVTSSNDTEQITIPCGCGDYGIEVSDSDPIYDFGAICPECGKHFGWSSDTDTEQSGEIRTDGGVVADGADAPLTPCGYGRDVLVALAETHDDDGISWVKTNAYVSPKTGMAPRKIARTIAQLKDDGYVEPWSENNSAKRWRLTAKGRREVEGQK